MMVLLVILTGFVSSSKPTGAFAANLPPVWDYTTDTFQSPVQIDLNRAFFDSDGDSLAFSVSSDPSMNVEISNEIVYIEGKGEVVLTASDGNILVSKKIKIN